VSAPDAFDPDPVLLALYTERDQLPWVVGALDSAPAAIAVVDGPEHRWLYANKTFRLATGDRPLIGSTFLESLPDLADAATFRGRLDHVRLTGEPYHAADTRVDLDRDGDGLNEESYFNIALSPVIGSDGQPRGVLVVAVETTSEVLARSSDERRAAREHVLLRILTASTTVLAAEAKLTALADAVVPALADACTVHVLAAPVPAGRPPKLPLLTHCTRTRPAGRLVRWWGDDPVTDAVAAGRTLIRPSRPRGMPRRDHEAGTLGPTQVLDVHNEAAVPVMDDGLVRAVILFAAATSRPPYGIDDLELFRLIAEQAAVTFRQGMRYEHVRDSSLTLQRALMTDPPAQLGDVQIRVRYEPAAIDAAVGGDWYDAFPLPSGDLAFVVGDVAGHDIDAASVMGQLRSMLRGFAYHLDAAPSTVLDALNHVLIGMRLATLTTGIYARLTPTDPDGGAQTHSVVWSNAGHPPPLLVHPDGHVDVLHGAHGAALGVVIDTPRADARVELPKGATLLLYTDGLIERRGEALDDGLARLVRRASAVAARSLDEMCDDLLMDAPDDDDIALVALRSHG
jgi:serine phosphatase RsbU (regulator of sigma subunit)